MTEDLFNPHSRDWLLKKFKIYENLRELNTAYWSEKYEMYVITRYDDVLFCLKNADIFSSSKGNLIVEMPHRFGSTLGASDNPKHDFYKNIVKDAYGKERIFYLDQKFKERIVRELNKFKTEKYINISQLIETLSAYLTTEILGLPTDSNKIESLIIEIQKKSTRAVLHDTDDTAYNEFIDIIDNLLKKEIRPTSPGIYNEYVKNNVKKYSIMSLFTGPALSGTSSLTGALEFLTLDVYKENQLNILLTQNSLIENCINESLRFHASTGRFSRTVTKEIELHGVKLTPGTRVALCLESANRDPAKYKNPDVFDLNRDTTGHLGFGYGIHACIALYISKIIMSSYLHVLLKEIGKYKIITEPKDYEYVITQSGNDDMITNLFLEKV